MDDKFYDIFLNAHILSIVMMFIFIGKNLWSTYNIKNDALYYTSIRKFTPIIHVFNAMNIYVGMTMAGFYHLFNIEVILMSIASIMIIILEAKRHKFMKNSMRDMDAVRVVATKNYKIELAIVIVVYIVTVTII